MMLKHLKLVETILYVDNQNISSIFYQNIFRQAPSLNVPGITEFIISDTCKIALMPNYGISKILGENMPHPQKGMGIPRCELYFLVENVQFEYENTLKCGATLISPIIDRDWGEKVCYFADTDGHILAFAESINP